MILKKKKSFLHVNNFLNWLKYKNEKQLGVIESVVSVCEERNIDTADVKSLIDSTLKGMIEEEALTMNMIKGSKANLSSFL